MTMAPAAMTIPAMSSSVISDRLVPELLLRGLFADRHHRHRQVADVEVADWLAEPLGDADLDLHAEREPAEHPDLVGAGEQIVHRLPDHVLVDRVHEVVVEKHERADGDEP